MSVTYTQTTGTAPIFGERSGKLVNTLQAPATVGLWRLRESLSTYLGADLLSTSGSMDFDIQVGQPVITTPQPTQAIQILQNGGFEAGLTGWTQIGNPHDGYASTGTQSNSGSASLALTLYTPKPGSSQFAPLVIGVSQTVNLPDGCTAFNVRGLFYPAMRSKLAYGQVQVTVDGVTSTYPLSRGGPLQPYWTGFDFDVPISPGARIAIISLELVGTTEITDTQFGYFDDVQAIATVPGILTSSTIATQSQVSSSVETQLNTQLSSTSESMSTQSQLVLTLSLEQIYVGMVSVLVLSLGVVSIFLYKARKKLRKRS